MELLAVCPQQLVCRNEMAMLSPLDLLTLDHSLQGNGLPALPDLEITPVVKTPAAMAYAKCIQDAIDRNTQNVIGENHKPTYTKEQLEIRALLHQLPMLDSYFVLHNKIGEGTFSTVYLATMKNGDSKQYAVKHLTQNCQQVRIDRELKCMSEIGGQDNVVKVEYCLHNGDECYTFIMPYLPHKRFSDYVLDMDVSETRLYMKNLFIALKRVHSFNVIHRDVKPGNFLYNRETKEFLLVDFGLAQVIEPTLRDVKTSSPTTDENQPIDYSQKRKRRTSSDEDSMSGGRREAKRVALKSKDSNIKIALGSSERNRENRENKITPSRMEDLKSPIKPTTTSCESISSKTPLKPRPFTPSPPLPSSSRKKLFREESPSLGASMLRAQLELKRLASFTPLASRTSSGSFVQVRNSRVIRQSPAPVGASCPCSGRGAVCMGCAGRKKMVAPRAGTPGFRPPEVLLKYVHQTTAVDMWASGVVLLCILSGCYPFFKSPNDLAALAEIMTIFGTTPIINIASKFGRRVVCSEQRRGVDLKRLCIRLRERGRRTSDSTSNSSSEEEVDVRCRECRQPVRRNGCICQGNTLPDNQNSSSLFPDSAYDLLSRLLDLDPTTRITAEEALQHPFLAHLDL